MATRARLLICLLATSVVASLAFAGTAAAQNDTNRGTVKIHDDMETDPEERNVPHVSCDFFVQGFNFNDPEGSLVFVSWPPTGDMSEVTPTGDDLNWTGTEDGDGEYDFLKGPYQLPPGHYRLEVYTDDGHPGHDQHFAKAKTFWVDECEGESEIPCPPDVSAEASVSEGEAVITVTWSAVEGADGYVVYRAVEGGEFEMVEATTDLTFVDEDVEAGLVYEYIVTAVIGNAESEGCESVSVTAIPFFPSLVVGALAMIGGVGAFTYMRRRS